MDVTHGAHILGNGNKRIEKRLYNPKQGDLSEWLFSSEYSWIDEEPKNYKSQITNYKQITMTNPPPADQTCLGHAQRRRLRRVLDIDIWDFIGIWCLEFEIS